MTSVVTRRLFVGWTTGGAAALSGCETAQIQKSLEAIAKEVVHEAGSELLKHASSGTTPWAGKDPYRDRPNTPAMRQEARTLYEAAQQGRLVELHLQRWQAANASSAQRLSGFESAINAGKVASLEDAMPWLEEGVLPMLRQGYTTLALENAIRGRSGKAPRRIKDTVYELPPGTGLRLRYRGKCMDSGLPAPNRGETLELRYIDIRLAPVLRPVFKAICKSNHERQNVGGQILTWIVMTAGRPNSFCDRMNPAQYQRLQEIYPQGGDIVRNYHERTKVIQKVANEIVKELPGSFGRIDFTKPAQVEKAVDQAIKEQIRAGERERKRNPNPGIPGINLIDPNVPAAAIGSGPLSCDATLINCGANTVTIDTTDFEAKPERKAQSISPVPGASTGYVTLQQQQPSAATAQGVEQATAATQGLLDRWGNLIKLIVNKGLELGSTMSTDRANRWIDMGLADPSAMKRLVGNAATMLPVVGNLLSLYEATTGKNWLTQEELSPIERAGAMLGTVPGAQVFKGLASQLAARGVSQSSLVSKLAQQAANSRIANAWDDPMVGYFREVVPDVLNNATIINAYYERHSWEEEKFIEPFKKVLSGL